MRYTRAGVLQGPGVNPVTVPAITAPNSKVLLNAPRRLVGWSLTASDIGGLSNTASVTSPAALAAIASVASVPPGIYSVEWIVELGGTLAAADANNFGLFVGTTQVAQAIIPAVAGVVAQEEVQINVPAGGATVAVKAIGAGTLASVYTATLTLVGGPPAQAVITDSGQTLGVTAMAPAATDTQILCEFGIYCAVNIGIQVNQGTISGVIYVCDELDPEYE